MRSKAKPKASDKQLVFQQSRNYEWGTGNVNRHYFDLPPNCVIRAIIFHLDMADNKGIDVPYEMNIYTQDSQQPSKYDIVPNKYNNINLKIVKGGIISILIEEPYKGYISIYFEK